MQVQKEGQVQVRIRHDLGEEGASQCGADCGCALLEAVSIARSCQSCSVSRRKRQRHSKLEGTARPGQAGQERASHHLPSLPSLPGHQPPGGFGRERVRVDVLLLVGPGCCRSD